MLLKPYEATGSRMSMYRFDTANENNNTADENNVPASGSVFAPATGVDFVPGTSAVFKPTYKTIQNNKNIIKQNNKTIMIQAIKNQILLAMGLQTRTRKEFIPVVIIKKNKRNEGGAESRLVYRMESRTSKELFKIV